VTSQVIDGAEQFFGELMKTRAFVRRDLLIALSYRLSFITDWVSLVVQMITFHFVGMMIDPNSLPIYDGQRATYVEFVSIGIAMTSFMYVALTRVVTAMRTEQLMGTLELLMISPTSTSVIQLGSAVWEAVYVPIRTTVFLCLVALIFDAHFNLLGVVPAMLVLAAFFPVIWGLGLISAASTLVVRRGGGLVGIATTALTITSGAYFPVALLPSWLDWLVTLNPIALTLDTMRDALLGSVVWSEIFGAIATLLPMAVVTLGLGVTAFKLALRRETRKGTLGTY
jgi:ABC-2 type transport system permease protein